jgi:ketosteroid isomerase-like protein
MDENIAIVRQVYEAFESQDLEAILNLTHPDCVITQDPTLPWGGTFKGHEGVTNFAMLLMGTTSSTLTISELFEADGKVFEVGRSAGTVNANGRAFDIPEVHVWAIKDGKIIEVYFAIDTPAMLAALA